MSDHTRFGGERENTLGTIDRRRGRQMTTITELLDMEERIAAAEDLLDSLDLHALSSQ